MNTRTTQQSVTFTRPFSLPGISAQQPAGTYVLEIDEEPIEELSFLAYRRTSTRLRLAPNPRQPGFVEIVTVDPKDIEALLALEKNAVP